MSKKNVVVTSVSAEGVAVADFDMARFVATATTSGASGKEAKDSLKKVVDQMTALYESLKAEKAAENLRTSVSVQPKHEWEKGNSRQKLVGYNATYTMIFHSSNLDRVSAIHDSLTNIKDVQANAPTFDVKNKSTLSKQAFEAAYKKCQERFETECNILGKNPDKYSVGSWSVHYSEDDRHGGGVRTLSAAAPMGGGGSPIEIHSGKAEVTCSLTVNYLKNSQ